MTTICRSNLARPARRRSQRDLARGADQSPSSSSWRRRPAATSGPQKSARSSRRSSRNPLAGAREGNADAATDILVVGLEPHEIRMSLRARAPPGLTRAIAHPDRPGRLGRLAGWPETWFGIRVGPIVSTPRRAAERRACVDGTAGLRPSGGVGESANPRRSFRPSPPRRRTQSRTVSGRSRPPVVLVGSVTWQWGAQRRGWPPYDLPRCAAVAAVARKAALRRRPRCRCRSRRRTSGRGRLRRAGRYRRALVHRGKPGARCRGPRKDRGKQSVTITNSSTPGITSGPSYLAAIAGLYLRPEGIAGIRLSPGVRSGREARVPPLVDRGDGTFVRPTIGVRLRLP